jgi:hypothetical protein
MLRSHFPIITTALLALFSITSPGSASAQTEGRIGVGGTVTFVSPTDDGVASTVSVGPLIRLNPRKGFGLAAGLNWFRADLEDPAGSGAPFARLRVRPLMAGVGYTMGSDKTLMTFSIVAGPSWNAIDFEEEFLRTQSGTPAIDVENSLVVRPGVSLSYSVAPRVGIGAFVGYMFNRPDLTYRNGAGQEFQNTWHADSVVLGAAMVYSLF